MEIYCLHVSNFINNALFQVCVVISIFIVFRLARVTNELVAGMAMKGLATLYDMGVWPVDFLR